jgi:poly-gamma-glutamate synthesis protein (capsule biosynthesis protein)
MSIVSISQSKLDGKKDFLITLEKHYSTIDSAVNLRPYVYTIERTGLVANWRGSALAWPLLDAVISADEKHYLCALHRGDSFIELNPNAKNTRIALYRWNGFGFTGVNDSTVCENCRKYFNN